MNIGKPEHPPTPGYPTRREVIRTGSLGLAALGLGAAAGSAGAAEPSGPPITGGVPRPPVPLGGVIRPPTDTPEKPPANIYFVRSGDTLASIARKQLGDEKRADEIVKANPGLNGRKPLKVGSKIVLPAGRKAPDPGPPMPGKLIMPK